MGAVKHVGYGVQSQPKINIQLERRLTLSYSNQLSTWLFNIQKSIFQLNTQHLTWSLVLENWARSILLIYPTCKAACKRRQHCCPTTPNIVGCYMLRPFAHRVACCCAKFETSQIFQPITPNISFVPWSPKRSATALDPSAKLFQYCWGRARLLRMVYIHLIRRFSI